MIYHHGKRGKLFFLCVDTLCKVLHRGTEIGSPKKILVSNLAHLGDIVVATSILPALKERFPQAEIGFLCGSWARDILLDHPLVSLVHHYDHPRLNREGPSPYSFKAALQEIREQQYDLAIDLYPYFPNSVYLLWRAKIPVRIGFTSAGLGPLLTHPVDWEEKEGYLPHYYKDLLPNLNVSPIPNLPRVKSSIEEEYTICHLGPTHLQKSWSKDKWEELLTLLYEKGEKVILTGRGEEEGGLKCFRNMCNSTSWREFTSLICHAKRVITIDSVPAHIAAAYQVPMILLSDNSSLWTPEYRGCKSLKISSTPKEVIKRCKV